jgi:cell division GTPase FtsZ
MEQPTGNRPGIESADAQRVEAIRIQFHDEVPHGARIKVIGVGGGGGNAVNRMIQAKHGGRGVYRRQHRRSGAQALAGSGQAAARRAPHRRPRRGRKSRRGPPRRS